MVSAMRFQYTKLRERGLKELEDIQSKFEEERKQYIENAKKEVDDCFDKHVKM